MTAEEKVFWNYQVRDRHGNVVGDWTSPAGVNFKWPRLGTGHEKWVKKRTKWVKLVK